MHPPDESKFLSLARGPGELRNDSLNVFVPILV